MLYSIKVAKGCFVFCCESLCKLLVKVCDGWANACPCPPLATPLILLCIWLFLDAVESSVSSLIK